MSNEIWDSLEKFESFWFVDSEKQLIFFLSFSLFDAFFRRKASFVRSLVALDAG